MIFDYILPDNTTGTVNADDMHGAINKLCRLFHYIDGMIAIRPSKLNDKPGPAPELKTPFNYVTHWDNLPLDVIMTTGTWVYGMNEDNINYK